MGDPTNTGPIGLGANSPTVDAGTLARTPNKPATTQGQAQPVRVAQKAEPAAAVLASFDIENAVVWVNQALLEALSQARAKKGYLPTGDVTSLAHEFAHVLQHKDVFEKFATREERAAEMIKQRAEEVAKSTEAEYVKSALAREKQAEKLAQRISVETLNHFDRARGRSGFSREEIEYLADAKANQWIEGLRENYLRKARQEYKSLTAKVAEHGGSEGVAKASAKKEKTTQKLLPVKKIQDVFPTDQSPTLEKLLRLMVKYDILIVVSLVQEDL